MLHSAAQEPAGFSRVAQARRHRGARSASLRLAVAQCFQPASAVAARDAANGDAVSATALGPAGRMCYGRRGRLRSGAGLARPVRHWGWVSGQRPAARFIPHQKITPACSVPQNDGVFLPRSSLPVSASARRRRPKPRGSRTRHAIAAGDSSFAPPADGYRCRHSHP